MSQNKGFRRERELVNLLHENGFRATRVPISGGGTKRDLPDILAGKGGNQYYAIEAKSSAGDPIYLTGEEVEALVYFSQEFGAKPRVAARFDREDWSFFHPSDLHYTDGGNYRIRKETAIVSGASMSELAVKQDPRLKAVEDKLKRLSRRNPKKLRAVINYIEAV